MKRLVSLAVVVVFAATATACTGEETVDGDVGLVELPRQNVDSWVMPLDGLLVSDADDFKRVYAQTLLAYDCLSAQGIAAPAPRLDVESMDGPTSRAGDGTRNLTVEWARAHGYLGGEDRSYLDDVNAFIDWAFSQTGTTAKLVDTCLGEADSALMSDEAYLPTAAAWLNGALAAAESDPSVEEPLGRWRSCVASEGIVGAGDSPTQMPTSEMMNALGVGGGNDDPDAWEPSGGEIAWAIADAQCQIDSGYREALYQAEWNAQVEVLTANVAEVQRLRVQMESWRQRIDETIAAHPSEHS